MNKVKFLLVLAFLVVLAAGAVVGMAVDRLQRAQAVEPPNNPHRHPPSPWMQFDRSLTPEQRERMKAMWSPVEEARNRRRDLWRQYSLKRDQEILDLLTPEQRTRYNAIQAEFRESIDQIERNITDAVHKAEDQTRAMLSPDQLKLYDDARARGGPPGRRGPGRGMRPHPLSAPTTMPSPAL